MSETHPRPVRPLEDLADASHDEVGGKARSLGVLTAAGFDVPGGFALLTGALEAFLEQSGLQEERARIDGILESGRIPDEGTLAAFRVRIEEAPFPDSLVRPIEEAFSQAFPGEPPAVAVRSSGTREDLEGASFAGQYETFLHVVGLSAVLGAIQRCWSSIWDARVLEYAQNRGGGATGLSMCVVVQQMVEADTAGVLFTVNPVTGREEEVLIEAVFGLGESLVSGKVTADRFIVHAHTHDVIEEVLADQSFKVVSTDDGVEEVSLGADEQRTLSPEQLTTLVRLSGDIQEHYGRPMDVEWAFSDGRLWVLQARPITKLSFAPDLGEWTTADFRDGGVSSAPCSTFMWSLYEYALEHSMPGYFKDIKLIPRHHDAKWSRMFFARPYWNLGEVKRALIPIPGFDEKSFYDDIGVEMEEDYQPTKTPTTVMGVLRALPTLFALNRNYRERLEADRAFVARFPERKAPYDLSAEDVASLDRDTFVARFETLLLDLYRDTETSYFSTIYNTSNSKLDLKPVFDKVNAIAGSTLDEPSLLGGLRNLSHLRPVKDLHRLIGELKQSGRSLDDTVVREYAMRWRHHGRKELDIREPRWPDDLPFVRDMMQTAFEHYDPNHDPDAMEATHHARYEEALAEALRPLTWRPLLRRSFLSKLARVREYAWWREEMRDHSSHAYYLVRLWALEAGRRLASEGVLDVATDIWNLSFREALSTIKGEHSTEEARARVARGRRELRSFRNFDNPNEIGSHFRFPETAAPPSGTSFSGTPCSPGQVTARACVITDLADAKKLQQGDILVTHFTDPGWTPLFARIQGVVTETGGVLSHAAVISREYGIPAVLAVKGATQAIRDGDTLVLDGTQGTVTITDRP